MFQKGRQAFLIMILSLLIEACSTSALPTWRDQTYPIVQELGREETFTMFPEEYRSLLETFEHGEAIYQVRKDDKGADLYYQLAYQKGEILKSRVKSELKRREDEKKRKLAEIAEKAEKAEKERLMRAELEAEAKLRAEQLAKSAEIERQAHKKVKEISQALPTSYIVRRGETLPQISARTEIYNDSTLWHIIYRANRDQISDPKRLWPGQVLVIPRNLSKDELAEARRHAK